MNKAIIIGRLTKEPEVKQTQSGLSFCFFTVATDRKFKGQNGEKVTDFIPCVAWRSVADIIGKYFHKGSKIGIVGTIQTRSYEDNSGNRVNVVEVNVEDIDFLDPKKQETEKAAEPVPEVLPIPPMGEAELPFDIMG